MIGKLAKVAILVISTSVLILHPARAQSSSAGNGIKLFVGMSRGDLKSESELLAFARLQEVVNSVVEHIQNRFVEVRTGDLPSRKSSEWGIKLLPVTHYIAAAAKKATADKIEVEWYVGKFSDSAPSASRKPSYAAVLRIRTAITFPTSNVGTIIEQLDGGKSISYNQPEESSEPILQRLRAVFPEMRREHAYFVDCFENQVKTWHDVNATVMWHLSQSLQSGQEPGADVLRPVWILPTSAMAISMCKDADYQQHQDLYHYRDAQIYVRGTMLLDTGTKKIRPVITVLDNVRAERQKFAIAQIEEDRPDQLLRLDQFCMRSKAPPRQRL